MSKQAQNKYSTGQFDYLFFHTSFHSDTPIFFNEALGRLRQDRRWPEQFEDQSRELAENPRLLSEEEEREVAIIIGRIYLKIGIYSKGGRWK